VVVDARVDRALATCMVPGLEQVHAWVSIETDIDTDIADSGATSGSTSATGGSAGGDNEPLGHKHRDNIENKENIDNIDKRGKKKVAVKVLRPDVRR